MEFQDGEEVAARKITNWKAEMLKETQNLDNNLETYFSDYDYLTDDYHYLYDYDFYWMKGDFKNLLNVIIRATSLLRCDVMNFKSKQTIRRFYIATYNESGFPRYVVNFDNKDKYDDLEFKLYAVITFKNDDTESTSY